MDHLGTQVRWPPKGHNACTLTLPWKLRRQFSAAEHMHMHTQSKEQPGCTRDSRLSVDFTGSTGVGLATCDT